MMPKTPKNSIRTRIRNPALLNSASADTISLVNPTDVAPNRHNDPHPDLALAIEYLAPSALKAPFRKLRKHNQRNLAAMRASISNLGFLDPILVDGDYRIICGHGRWLAAKDLGLEQVPVICAAHLSEKQKRVYAIAENRIGELSEWDSCELRLEFKDILDLGSNYDLSIELSGFSTSEID